MQVLDQDQRGKKNQLITLQKGEDAQALNQKKRNISKAHATH